MKKLSVQTRSFITSILVILGLMILTYVLTFFIKPGQYLYDDSGAIVSGSFEYINYKFPFYKFILAPFLIFGSSDATTIILIIVFLLIVSGTTYILNKSGLMKYIIEKLINKFGSRKYYLLYIITLIFMLMGSFIGSFEEVVPFIPVIVSLSIGLGWDTFTGIALSLLAAASGFASGILNPFSVGIASSLAGISVTEGILIRVITFVVIYALLTTFLRVYTKRLKPSDNADSSTKVEFVENDNMKKAAKAFVISMVCAVGLVIGCSFVKFLRDYSIVFVCFGFISASIFTCVFNKLGVKTYFAYFARGVVEMLPAIIMIMLASSIKYILVESKRIDTILYFLVNTADGLHPFVVLLLIYLTALVLNFFVPSGSAKAFLLIPLLTPLAKVFNIPLCLMVIAYAYGDGFSNAFYPSNPVLLIGLSLTNSSYFSYFKRAWIYQVLVLLVTVLILFLSFLVLA